MIVKSIEELTIYESPDGGKTIYSRKSGSSDRNLIQEDSSIKVNQRWLTWKEILKLAETEPSLRDAIEQAEIVYALIKKETD
jgi:HD superfamily phosphodiesterase